MVQTSIIQNENNYNSFFEAYKNFIIKYKWCNESLILGLSDVQIEKLKDTLGIHISLSLRSYLKNFGHSFNLKYYSDNINFGSAALIRSSNALKRYKDDEIDLLKKIASIINIDDEESEHLKKQPILSPLFFFYEESSQVFGLLDQHQENPIIYFYYLYTDYFTEGKAKLTDYMRRWLWKGIIDELIRGSNESRENNEALNDLDWVQFYLPLKNKNLFWVNIHEYRNEFQLEIAHKEKSTLLGINEYEEAFVYFLMDKNYVKF